MHAKRQIALLGTAMTLAIPGPAPACDDDRRDKALCLTLTHMAVRANAKAGKWLDPVTRHDGVAVDCDDKEIEFKRFVSVPVERVRHGWRESREEEWNRVSCTNALSREALNKDWTLRVTYTTVTGDNVSFEAECD